MTAQEVIGLELAEWDDEFESPKWEAHTRGQMAEAIYARLCCAEGYGTSGPTSWWDRWRYDVTSTARRFTTLGAAWVTAWSLLDVAHGWWH